VALRARTGRASAPLLIAVLSSAPLLIRAEEPAPGIEDRYTTVEYMIPMRDGVRLHTAVYLPKEQREPLPILLKRTPYGVKTPPPLAPWKELVDEGFIFARQDIRGRYGSEGSFVMLRPPRDPKVATSVDETTDAWDTVDWLVKQVPRNNGRVGIYGVSYDGWLAVMAALDPHPAVKAVSPQASPADMWIGDDFHHNGAFRLSYGFEYAAELETSKEDTYFDFDRYDTYLWYLTLGPLRNVNARYFHGTLPTWNDFVAHPDYDAFWKAQAVAPRIQDVRVPLLHVGGMWDQEDFYGPVRIYDAFEARDTGHRSSLVLGPWNHGGWWKGDGRKLGGVDFGVPTGTHFREQVQTPWFAYYLKDKGRLRQPEALVFEAGSNTWRSWDAWPPAGQTRDRELYLHEGQRLSFDAPEGAPEAFDSYVSDPAHPVPYRNRPVQPTYFPHGSLWSTWLLEDQRFADDRPDVLAFETAILDSDVTIAGRIVARLFASTTGSDSDWIVKLIDVYPEKIPEDWAHAGYELMVANEVLRGRYRKSFERPEAVVPGEVTPYTVDLHTQSYCFKAGHRIMVQIQSSWFPVIDRNPQTFVPNIFLARESDFRAATQRIHRSRQFPTHVTLPVVETSSLVARKR
jgi:putative CocE/NonD family hydrolase